MKREGEDGLERYKAVEGWWRDRVPSNGTAVAVVVLFAAWLLFA